MYIWIVWSNPEYIDEEEIFAVYDTEEKARKQAKDMDKSYHAQLRKQGAQDHLPEDGKMKPGVSYFAVGYPRHRVSRHEIK